jgi:hypothetical protein
MTCGAQQVSAGPAGAWPPTPLAPSCSWTLVQTISAHGTTVTSPRGGACANAHEMVADGLSETDSLQSVHAAQSCIRLHTYCATLHVTAH